MCHAYSLSITSFIPYQTLVYMDNYTPQVRVIDATRLHLLQSTSLSMLSQCQANQPSFWVPWPRSIKCGWWVAPSLRWTETSCTTQAQSSLQPENVLLNIGRWDLLAIFCEVMLIINHFSLMNYLPEFFLFSAKIFCQKCSMYGMLLKKGLAV